MVDRLEVDTEGDEEDVFSIVSSVGPKHSGGTGLEGHFRNLSTSTTEESPVPRKKPSQSMSRTVNDQTIEIPRDLHWMRFPEEIDPNNLGQIREAMTECQRIHSILKSQALVLENKARFSWQ